MPKKILIVEDEANIRELLRLYLEREGYTVLEAENGVEGIKKWKSDKPDMLLLDVMMPVMDGIEAVKAIRGLDREDAGTIPIFAMTAQASSENVRKCLNAGMDGHIPKPIEASKLGSTILKVKVHRN